MSLFKLDLNVEEEYKELLTDVIKYSSILIIAYIMQNMSSKLDFMNEDFFDAATYIMIGVITYHLVIKKIIVISPT